MKFYFISGIPGSGKSSVSKALAKELDICHVIGTDSIRAMIQRYHNADEYPVLFESSFNACKHAPDTVSNPVIWGFFEQARLIKPAVKGLFKRQISENEDLILEGVHLVPGYYHVPEGVDFHHILVTVTDKDKYIHQIFSQGRGNAEDKANAIERCLEYQDFMIQKALEYNEYHEKTKGQNPRDSRPVTIIENDGTLEELISKILKETKEITSGDNE